MTTTLNASTAGAGGFIATSDNSGVLALQTAGTTAITVDASQRVAFVAGTAALPAITTAGDTNTGIYFPAADTIAFSEGGTESMRIDSSGNVGIGTSSPQSFLHVGTTSGLTPQIKCGNTSSYQLQLGYNNSSEYGFLQAYAANLSTPDDIVINPSGGNLLVGKTATGDTAGITLYSNGTGYFVRSSGNVLEINRLTTDGTLILFAQDSSNEGSISVSGTTVSYNGGHLSRWAQMLTKPDLLKGTVMSNLDAMNVYTDAEGNPVANEQLNKVKVSDVESDANVAGVFVNWSYDEQHSVDEINMAMTGDMIIRIAQGVTVQRGDLLMSAGDGTAKAQSDDIVRSKTIAKVTSNHVTCTYADGSYCVPCVLMAC